MSNYEITMYIEPKRVFGLYDEGWVIAGPGDRLTLNVDPNRMSLEERRGTGRNEKSRLELTQDLGEMSMSIIDNEIKWHVQEENHEKALEIVEAAMHRLWGLVNVALVGSEPFKFSVIDIVRDGVESILPRRTFVSFKYQYNIEMLNDSIKMALRLMNELDADPVLDEALRFFTLGEKLHFGAGGGHLAVTNPAVDLDDGLSPVSFLQYYKALVTIVGEKSEKDHQSRYSSYGLSGKFYKNRILPNHDVRDDNGVAHLLSRKATGQVTRQQVTACRQAAQEAILAYANSRRILTEADSPTIPV